MQTISTALNTTMTWGAAPFVMLSLSAWLVPEQHLIDVQTGFLAYSVMIFSFMTGTLWGGRLLSVSTEDKDPQTLLLAIGSFLFVLLAAALAYFWGIVPGLILLALAYLALPLIERQAALAYPSNYVELRRKINRTVVVSHLVIIVHALQPHAA